MHQGRKAAPRLVLPRPCCKETLRINNRKRASHDCNGVLELHTDLALSNDRLSLAHVRIHRLASNSCSLNQMLQASVEYDAREGQNTQVSSLKCSQ